MAKTFHQYWGDAVGKPGYNKGSWKELRLRYDDAVARNNEKAQRTLMEEARQLSEAQQRPQN